jgi:hypothetical protein
MFVPSGSAQIGTTAAFAAVVTFTLTMADEPDVKSTV